MTRPAEIEKSGTGIKRHGHELACRLYARPDDPTPAIENTPMNIAAQRIDNLVRRVMTREMTFAELHQSVKAELEFVLEAGGAASEVQNENPE